MGIDTVSPSRHLPEGRPTSKQCRPPSRSVAALCVQAPATYRAEREYVYSVLLGDFLGLDFQIQWHQRDDVLISAGDAKELRVADVFFGQPEGQWLTPASLPPQPLRTWRPPPQPNAVDWPLASLPVIFGDPCDSTRFLELGSDSIRTGLDVFGSAFFMLTRYEEVVRKERDEWGRFPAGQSLALQEGFLDRPIVNDYLEFLWHLMRRLWPGLERKQRSFQFEPTHDVDQPYRVTPFRTGIRTVGKDLLHRRNLPSAARSLCNTLLSACGLPHRDPLDTFDWLMDLSEEHGCSSAFYFMSSAAYRVNSRPIRRLMRHIVSRGHELGVHPYFGTDRDPQQLRREVDAVGRAMEQEGLGSQAMGGRQHSLSWEAPTTWQLYEDAGLAYDSTLSFADRAGFRCGTCYAYPVFNLLARKPLDLIERPLLVMECSLFHEKYMGMNHDRAREYLQGICDKVRRCRGSFRVLWHNSWFDGNERESEFYRWLFQM